MTDSIVFYSLALILGAGINIMLISTDFRSLQSLAGLPPHPQDDTFIPTDSIVNSMNDSEKPDLTSLSEEEMEAVAVDITDKTELLESARSTQSGNILRAIEHAESNANRQIL